MSEPKPPAPPQRPWLDEVRARLREAIDALLPAPEPVPVPVRVRVRPRGR